MLARRLSALASLSLVACGAVSPEEPQQGALPTEPAPAAEARRCATTQLDLEVAADDLDGYPPYAVANCTLVYLARDGALLARDLNSGAEIRLAGPGETARRPSIDGGVVAWEAVVDAHRVVKVHAGGKTTVLTGPFAAATEPRVRGTSVVFTAWAGGPREDTDIWLYDAKSGALAPVLGGAGQQRFADVSADFVVATDASEDPDGAFDDDGRDVTDLVVFDRKTGNITRRASPGKQAFPLLLEGGGVAYLHWPPAQPRGYELKVGRVLDAAPLDRTLATATNRNVGPRPAATGQTLEWVTEGPDGTTSLYRASVDASRAPARVAGLEGLRLFAPVSTRDFTLVATVASAQNARLKIVLR